MTETAALRPGALAGRLASREALFSPERITSITVAERYAIAAYVARLSLDSAMEALSLAQADEAGLDYELQKTIAVGDLAAIDDPRLKLMLDYAEILVRQPKKGDETWIKALRSAGLSEGDIVLLSQMIAFLTFEIRLNSGLAAIEAAQ